TRLRHGHGAQRHHRVRRRHRLHPAAPARKLAMIEIEGVSKSYGPARVVDDVSLTIAKGGLTAIIGPNGAGKSTLLSIMARLLPMDGGRVAVDGLDVTTTRGDVLARRLAVLR